MWLSICLIGCVRSPHSGLYTGWSEIQLSTSGALSQAPTNQEHFDNENTLLILSVQKYLYYRAAKKCTSNICWIHITLNNKAENIQTNAKKALVMLFTPIQHLTIKPCSLKKRKIYIETVLLQSSVLTGTRKLWIREFPLVYVYPWSQE